MANFFEKLKKGMGIEEEMEEKAVKEKKTLRPKLKRVPREKPMMEIKRLEIKAEPIKTEIRIEPEVKIEPKIEKRKEIKIAKPAMEENIEAEKPSFAEASEGKEKWLEPEGQLAIDVFQTETELIIQSAIAGVRPEDLDLSVEGDVLTIKGKRTKPFEANGDYFYQECYWGSFSRQLILPVEIDPNRIEATLKEGILTIRTPKIQREKRRRITVKE